MLNFEVFLGNFLKNQILMKIEFYVLDLKTYTIFPFKIHSVLQHVFNNTCNISREYAKKFGEQIFFEFRKHMSKNIGCHILVIG